MAGLGCLVVPRRDAAPLLQAVGATFHGIAALADVAVEGRRAASEAASPGPAGDPAQATKVEEFKTQGYAVEPCVHDASGNTAVVSFPTLDKLVEEVEAHGHPADLVESADEHMDEWTGDNFDEAAAVLDAKVGAVVSMSGMNPDAQARFRREFLAPVQDGIAGAGRTAVETGQGWDKAAGPLLIVLTPAA
ncbi:hypothetical protein [Streptomyces thermoalcalitolerans]|uniref:hypothetical protein n=1 Tax=Streptomyces thermoalcalitolerans TaxID=65605 RepID=UPI003CD0B0E2